MVITGCCSGRHRLDYVKEGALNGEEEVFTAVFVVFFITLSLRSGVFIFRLVWWRYDQ
jgi:hypothetical protein